MMFEHEAKHGREYEQQREDREKAVVGDRGGEIAALIVGVLLQDREREPQPPMPLLETIKRAVPLAESAQPVTAQPVTPKRYANHLHPAHRFRQAIGTGRDSVPQA